MLCQNNSNCNNSNKAYIGLTKSKSSPSSYVVPLIFVTQLMNCVKVFYATSVVTLRPIIVLSSLTRMSASLYLQKLYFNTSVL